MGKTYRKLKDENKKLRREAQVARDEAEMLRKGFVEKHNVKPGDLVVFRTDTLGAAFGYGVSALQWLERAFGDLAGGKVVAMACKPTFTIETLTESDQKAMRSALDKLDALRKEKATPKCGHSPVHQYRVDGQTRCLQCDDDKPAPVVKPPPAPTVPSTRPYGDPGFMKRGSMSKGEIANLALEVVTGKVPSVTSKPFEEMDYVRKEESYTAHDTLAKAPPEKIRFCFYCGGKMVANKGRFEQIICDPCVKKGTHCE